MPKYFRELLHNQSGYMVIFFALGLILVVLIMLRGTYSPLPPETDSNAPVYCREVIKDANPPTIEEPAYTSAGVDETRMQKYKMVKKNVPITGYYFATTHHFVQPFSKVIQDPVTKRKYLMKIPNGDNGRSYNIPTQEGTQFMTFADYGMIYLFYINDDETPMIVDHFTRVDGVDQPVALADIYIAADKTLPDWVLKCNDTGPNGETNNIVYQRSEMYTPSQNPSQDQEQLQLQYFLLHKYKLLLQSWWTPHCKPAIYLYPSKPEMINVRVNPDGFLTLTDPHYDTKKGWTVMAYPDGTLQNFSLDGDNNKFYDYLYFEAKIRDQIITKPNQGWSVKYEDLTNFYNDILPKLGFTQKQQTDFINYWTKSLPKSPYYFVSLVKPEEVNTYEQLLIDPKPSSVTRVRFYFEPKDINIEVQPLDLSVWQQNSQDTSQDLRVFEWGGMIKQDKNHPFTCSM